MRTFMVASKANQTTASVTVAAVAVAVMYAFNACKPFTHGQSLTWHDAKVE